jgi:hypothetical protein
VAAPLPYNGYAPTTRARRAHYRHYSRHSSRYHRLRYAHARHHAAQERRQASVERRQAPVERRQASIERRQASVERRQRTPEIVSAAEVSTPATLGRRSVCVRACDGYFFPIANLSRSSEVASHQATCDKLCPGAETRLFVMPAGSDTIDQAVAARGGDAYTQLIARVDPADAKTKACSCHSVAGDPVESGALLTDFTLRPGDTVVTPQGIKVVRRGSRYPFKKTDFLSLAETRDMPISTRGALFAIERALKTPYGRLAVANERRRDRFGHKRDLRL